MAQAYMTATLANRLKARFFQRFDDFVGPQQGQRRH
jgi:hypothetical protein